MKLALAPHVRLALIGEDLVLLDIVADAYFAVPEGARDLTLCEGGRAIVVEDDTASDWLETGYAKDGPSNVAPAPPRLPSATAMSGEDEALAGGDALALAGAFLDVLRDYRGRSFEELLRAARRPRPRDGRREAHPQEVARLSRAFAAAAVWLPIQGKCLARSFALLRFLQRRGCDADWVFGVRTWPFGAHCWLQAGGCALDDTPEQLAAYTPIMVA